VCGLLAEIRRATYLANRDGSVKGPVLFTLDEVANIAPIEELPQIASEGGGQGLTLLAALQDLSQARARWGTAADGFLTLFGTKLILPGIADTRTLESISLMLSEYDRQMVATTRPAGNVLLNALAMEPGTPSRTQTTSTQRTRVLSPGEIAGIPAGRRAPPRRHPVGTPDANPRPCERAVEDHPRHHRRRALTLNGTPASPAGAEPVAVSQGSPAARPARRGWPGGGSRCPDVFGHLEDSTISAWSVTPVIELSWG
jgi:hypothetical protein